MLTVAMPYKAHLSLYEKQEMEMMEELLSMDFDENADFEPFQNVGAIHRASDQQCLEITPIKAAHEKTGSKLRRDNSVVKSKRGKRVVSPVPMLEPAKFPNMSRKPRTNMLYVFPIFDKCDSLIYFPNTLSRHLNSSDFPGLLKLFQTHLERTCEITFCNGINPNIKEMVKLFEMMDQIHPDTIMCVHNTKVIENELYATTYAKFTDSRPLRESVIRNTSDSLARKMFCDREECFRERAHHTLKVDNVKNEEMEAILKSENDVSVYMKITIRLTFDGITKKGVKLVFDTEVTSLQAIA